MRTNELLNFVRLELLDCELDHPHEQLFAPIHCRDMQTAFSREHRQTVAMVYMHHSEQFWLEHKKLHRELKRGAGVTYDQCMDWEGPHLVWRPQSGRRPRELLDDRVKNL